MWSRVFPLLSNMPPAIWAEQIFIPEIVFFSLVRISALKFSGLRAHFFQRRRRMNSQSTTQGSNTSQRSLCCWWWPRRHNRWTRHESCHVTFLGWHMKSFNLSCRLYLDARLYSEVLLYMDIKWCGWPGLKEKVSSGLLRMLVASMILGSLSGVFDLLPWWEWWWERQSFRFESLFMSQRWAAGYVHNRF